LQAKNSNARRARQLQGPKKKSTPTMKKLKAVKNQKQSSKEREKEEEQIKEKLRALGYM